jgi:hypothetical protein
MFTASFLDPPKIKTAVDYYEVDLVTLAANRWVPSKKKLYVVQLSGFSR